MWVFVKKKKLALFWGASARFGYVFAFGSVLSPVQFHKTDSVNHVYLCSEMCGKLNLHALP